MKEYYSVLGNGNHSKRVQKILKKLKKNFKVYTSKDLKIRNKILEILDSKATFIITPNHTHWKLIKLFKNNYIFCEKTPVTKSKDLNNLKKISYNKIFFNFNRKFSKIYFYLDKIIKKYKLGNLIYGLFTSSKGLALKKSYNSNWRSKKKFNKSGVFETVSIHSLDLINELFGIKKIKNISKNNSKVGNAPDTSFGEVKVNSGNIINVFSTYNSSLDIFIKLYFKNGIFEYDGKYLSLKYPTKKFDNKGQFVTPPVVFKEKIIFNNDYLFSLEKSIKYFINKVDSKKFFSKKEFNNSVKINKYVI